jgi:hypothetical protein
MLLRRFWIASDSGREAVMTKLMTSHEAYQAMYAFLDAYYRRGKFKEVATLLEALVILPDGSPANPAFKGDWDKAVAATLNRTSHHHCSDASRG